MSTRTSLAPRLVSQEDNSEKTFREFKEHEITDAMIRRNKLINC